ncbi:MAG: N-glycosylase/DNA lyase [Nitrososphaerota archaeon]|jgi:N-glycosylase/DNA lyase|nr:N-glycosylase/DNA lyase [Nitrososphaerota archaeon]MDG6927257.1 N-glycosylase/DNA lyase [Nitrososphaerota archaeon]MDG6932592.1 N-glycosylase/DNA lyase [Nitrososphaerota archaeon]MDG6935670.1 N-glycosylase/DNA lyase [Nitrososphaerota archaeon]MDG6943445.1 N-glycosylase/DNA lyase [Nitrososphaerota archaeon]
MGLTLKSVGLDYIYSLENEDPQLISLRELAAKLENGVFYDVSLLAALVAYRLRGTGELYWSDLAKTHEFTPSSPFDIVENFLVSRRELAIRGKLARLEKLRKANFSVMENFVEYKNDPKKLYDRISGALNGGGEKTLSFAIKIFYYSVLAKENQRIALPYSIPIPVDSRVIKVSQAIGLINAECSEQNKISEAWNLISRISNIQPLHIDSYIWLKLYKVMHQGATIKS